MQQPALSFQRISADDAHKQLNSIAAKFEEELSTAAAAASSIPVVPKRGPGRPPKKRELALIAPPEPPAQKPRTGEYTNWFSSPHIQQMLHTLEVYGFNAKRTVRELKRRAPDVYARLSDSTVRAWFQKGTHTLLPAFQEQLKAQKAAARGGRPALMSVEVEDECKRILLHLRESGLPVNSHVIRWTLQAVFTNKAPALLANLKLSQQWISYWARSKLQWRWRSRTTAASKLPLDWEQQGVEAAKRVAYWMGMHSVSHHAFSKQLQKFDNVHIP